MIRTIVGALFIILLLIIAGRLASLIVLAAPLWYLLLYVALRAASAPVRKLTQNIWISLAAVAVMTAAFVAPMRGAVMLAYAFLGRSPAPLRSLDPEYVKWCLAPSPWFWIVVGICGALYGLWLVFGDGLWHLKLANAVANLPTLKTRSVSAGLAELHGVVRRRDPTPSADAVPIGITRRSWAERASKAVLYRRVDDDGSFERMEPFYLEDKSGSVLVDAQGASFREPFLLSLFIPYRVREVVLTHRTWNDDVQNARESWLEEGDEVYVIGQVGKANFGPGHDHFVVRPSEGGAADLILQLLRGELWLRRFRGESEVFFLSDSSEASIRKLILGRMYQKLTAGMVWIVLSTVLLLPAW